jgi:hypothetical protein
MIGLREFDQGLSHFPQQHSSIFKVIPYVQICCCDNNVTIIECMAIKECCKVVVVDNTNDEDLKWCIVKKLSDQRLMKM